jgi:uncharacterized protein (DUF952 family)
VTLLHIAVRAEWQASGPDSASAEYAPPAFAHEGFVHCSFREQVVDTASRYYAGRDDVVLLEIDENRLTSRLVVEPSPSTGDLFPHIYGPINRAAVVAVHEFRPDADGVFSLPDSLAGEP